MKICVPVSYGGHLTQILRLLPDFKEHDIFLVTFYHERLEKQGLRFYSVEDPERNPFKLFKLFVKALSIFLKERPDIVLSTGANVAIPFFLLGKLFNKKLVYIESISRVTKPSLSGKIAYKISDLFFIQWTDLKKHYPNAIYAGRLM